MQRIAQGRRSGFFMGTDFTYEDMDPEKIDAHIYTHLEPETLDDIPCHVIEAVPADEQTRRSSGYSKRILWIDTNRLVTVKIAFFDQQGHHIKTQTHHGFEKIRDDAWRAKRSLMVHHAKEHQTEIIVEARDADTELDDAFFTERHILTGRYLN
jgi:hypothetical protein